MKLISMVSLGCSKNLVDSETILGILAGGGYTVTPSPEDADIILINTCGFIKPAVKEAFAAILRCLQLKEKGSCELVIVFGCLVARYGEKRLSQLFPQVDGWLGVDAASVALQYLDSILAGEKPLISVNKKDDAEYARMLSTPSYTAYLKIAEGCSHRCSFCMIPHIRGPLRSKTPQAILREAVQLAAAGVKELILLAQDSGAYGRDLPEKPTLAGILKELAQVNGLRWIRFLYHSPHSLTPELVAVMQEEPKICRYLDLPVQHINRNILKRMGRRGDIYYYLQLIDDLRTALPDLTLRTTLMVGFPGEDVKSFRELREFVSLAEFDRLGIFPYFHEEGTRSSGFAETVSYMDKRRMAREIMLMQRRISRRKNEGLVGRNLDVLIEHKLGDEVWWGRSFRDAPDIDPRVIVTGRGLSPGNFIQVRITQAAAYDLIGVALP